MPIETLNMRSSSSRTSLAALLALVAMLAIAVSACGHGSGSGPAGSPAKAIPASAIVYAQVNLDTSSPAWTAFEKVSRRFPGWQQVVARVHSELLNSKDHGVSFGKDVEPALGDDAAIAVTGGRWLGRVIDPFLIRVVTAVVLASLGIYVAVAALS